MTLVWPQIDFIKEGSADCPLLRISGANLKTTHELIQAIRRMRDCMMDSFILHEVPGFEMSKKPELVFEIADSNFGVRKSSEGNRFIWTLPRNGWTRVEDLLAPFFSRDLPGASFQWLDESGEISVLFSPAGGW